MPRPVTAAGSIAAAALLAGVQLALQAAATAAGHGQILWEPIAASFIAGAAIYLAAALLHEQLPSPAQQAVIQQLTALLFQVAAGFASARTARPPVIPPTGTPFSPPNEAERPEPQERSGSPNRGGP